MSVAAIHTALELENLSGGERLTAFALASYANREQLAWPGVPAAAARAGLSRSQYLQAHRSLEDRGLIAVIDRGGGRGRTGTVRLEFAATTFDPGRRVNPQLFEHALTHSVTRGVARQLIAALAALADEDRAVVGLSTAEIRAAAGLSDSSYRRARTVLLTSGELLLEDAGGGRGNTNRWQLNLPREPVPRKSRRVASPRGARPLTR